MGRAPADELNHDVTSIGRDGLVAREVSIENPDKRVAGKVFQTRVYDEQVAAIYPR